MIALLWLVGCGPHCEDAPCVVAEELPAGLLSVQAYASDDVFVTGGFDSEGPTVYRYNGDDWVRVDLGDQGEVELWWSWISDEEAVFVGTEGTIIEMSRYSGEVVNAAGIGTTTTLFGVWGADGSELWAVGQRGGDTPGPAIYRRLDGTWAPYLDLQLDDLDESDTWFKVHGTAADDVWIVGTRGRTLHYDGTAWSQIPTDEDTQTASAPLLTVTTNGEVPIAVGGAGNGLVLEYDGTAWRDASPAFQPGLNGVCAQGSTAWTVGQRGARSTRVGDRTWSTDDGRELAPITLDDWHACDIDPDGGLWMVGGRIASRPLIRGVIGYQGDDPPRFLRSGATPPTTVLGPGAQ